MIFDRAQIIRRFWFSSFRFCLVPCLIFDGYGLFLSLYQLAPFDPTKKKKKKKVVAESSTGPRTGNFDSNPTPGTYDGDFNYVAVETSLFLFSAIFDTELRYLISVSAINDGLESTYTGLVSV